MNTLNINKKFMESLDETDVNTINNIYKEQIEQLKLHSNWAQMYLIGTIIQIEKSKTNMSIITIKDSSTSTEYRVQCWNHANEQILNGEFSIGSVISCIAHPSYYRIYDTEKISIKTHSISTFSSLMVIKGSINSEWFKGKGIDANYQVFTVKDANDNGKIIHCYLEKTNTLMRLIKKGAFVKVTGRPYIKTEDDKSHRLLLYVTNLEVING